ncbi:hypothetical protein [Sphingomonas sp.]|jgi:hypothetical protein|uniref:hypothetical protein n=1 Tax=Sphingomonas sp. TaxID=28214 RepID=UPI002DE60B31|nr:hypothetical protein [Sphingomonas sp.]
MPDYSFVDEMLAELPPQADDKAWSPIVKELVDLWLYDYSTFGSPSGSVWTTVDKANYLFSVTDSRLIAAWGVSGGRVDHKRDSSRQKQSPKGGDTYVHRGHAIPHTLGGGLDINLVPQLGRINTGPFQILEGEARDHPGALYFTYWSYKLSDIRGGPRAQRPGRVEQGLLIPGQAAKISRFIN